MARRTPGEGSIFQRRDGRWAGKVALPWEAGGGVKTVYGKSAAEVQAKLLEVRTTVAAGKFPGDGRTTVAAFLDSWLAQLDGKVKPATSANYRTVCAAYIAPSLGKVKLAALRAQHVERMMRELADRGLSARTQQLARSVLRRALATAIRWRLVTTNAAAESEPPKQEAGEGRALTADECRALIAAAEGEERLFVVLGLTTGARRGELLGLQWADVDLDGAELTIRRTLSAAPGGVAVGTPKTQGSARTVALPRLAVDALREHRKHQAARRLAASSWAEGDWVFTSSAGTPVHPRNLNRAFTRLCAQAGLDAELAHPHALRHTFATLGLEAGQSLDVVSKSLGHSSIRVTADVYGHVGRRRQGELADAVADQLA